MCAGRPPLAARQPSFLGRQAKNQSKAYYLFFFIFFLTPRPTSEARAGTHDLRRERSHRDQPAKRTQGKGRIARRAGKTPRATNTRRSERSERSKAEPMPPLLAERAKRAKQQRRRHGRSPSEARSEARLCERAKRTSTAAAAKRLPSVIASERSERAQITTTDKLHCLRGRTEGKPSAL